MVDKKKVLYIDGVGPFGGASRSLYEAVSCLTKNDYVTPFFLVASGSANKYYSKIAQDLISIKGLSRFDNTAYSYYRGVRWLVLLRELFHVPYMLYGLILAKIRWKKFDLIHVNEVTEIIPGLIARYLFKCPLIVHVRSVQSEINNFRTRAIRSILKRVEGVICIDETVARSLGAETSKVVIHNSFSVEGDEKDTNFRAKILEYKRQVRVGFVGNLQKIKGVLDLVEAARILKDRRDVVFLIVGDMTEKKKLFRTLIERILGLSQDTKAVVLETISLNNMGENVIFLGRTQDISAAYENFDILCFPSHLNAPGRPVFEAAFFAVPSIVCVENPTPDTIVPGVTGVIVPEQNPEALAAVIDDLASNPERRKRMGMEARHLALQNFEPIANANKLKDFYISVSD